MGVCCFCVCVVFVCVVFVCVFCYGFEDENPAQFLKNKKERDRAILFDSISDRGDLKIQNLGF